MDNKEIISNIEELKKRGAIINLVGYNLDSVIIIHKGLSVDLKTHVYRNGYNVYINIYKEDLSSLPDVLAKAYKELDAAHNERLYDKAHPDLLKAIGAVI